MDPLSAIPKSLREPGVALKFQDPDVSIKSMAKEATFY